MKGRKQYAPICRVICSAENSSALLRKSVHQDGGPLIHNGSEEDQRSLDATCRKLHRVLTQSQP